MNFENDIKQLVERFAPITLSQMDSVKLMQRVDQKYVLPIRQLSVLLKKALLDYYMLEIGGIREQEYATTYFDTADYQMYTLHHNGKKNRHKIRVRRYVSSEMEFLEVKRKNNKGETIKSRISKPLDEDNLDFVGSEGFLKKYTPYNERTLWPKLGNRFFRITLVNKDMSERVTIDYQLKFYDLKYHTQKITDNFCIVEIKRDRDSKKSPLMSTLSTMKARPSGFSKYCMGLAMLNPEVKNNLFKQRIRELEKF